MIFTIIDAVIILKNLINGVNMSTMRRWGMEVYGSNTNPLVSRRTFIEELIRSLITTPFSTILYPICAYYFFFGKNNKEKISYLLYNVIYLFLASFAGGGGRLSFIYFFLCYIFGFFLFSKNIYYKKFKIKKYRKIVVSFLTFGIILIFIVTNVRTGYGNFFKQIYTYFGMAPTLLSVWLSTIKTYDYTYGFLTLFGFHSYFFRIFSTLGLSFFVPEIYNNSYNYLLNAEVFRQIGSGVSNAFVTPIYYYYIDFGYFGIVLFSFIFGLISSRFYKKFKYKNNIKMFCHYCLLMYAIFISFIRIQTTIPSYIISFLLLLFVFRGDKDE